MPRMNTSSHAAGLYNCSHVSMVVIDVLIALVVQDDADVNMAVWFLFACLHC